MIEFWFKAWLVLSVVFTVLYLITILGASHEKTKSFIFALVAGPIAAAVATALALVLYWIVVIEAH